MTFYGISYLQNNAGVNDYIKYGLIFAALLFLIFVFSAYLRHRLDTKYRDLTIIMLLLLLFLLGVNILITNKIKPIILNHLRWCILLKEWHKMKLSHPKKFM